MESEQGLSVRVLFAGACRGNFNKLWKRVDKVHNRNGPFDALFCVGNFFSEPESTQGAAESLDEELKQFLDSSQQMPMKTYILGACGRDSELAKIKMQEVDCNIHCLGRSGILEMPNGLTVAFLEGVYDDDHFDQEPSDDRYYTKHDIDTLKKTVQSHGGDIDFFLSCEWPTGITNNLPEGSVEEYGALPEGSQHISSLLTIIRPRYHVTSQPPLCFTRIPYINPDLGAGSHVTRFTSLCPFGNVAKQNLFALCMTPAQFMTQEKLCEIPPDATEFPFAMSEGVKREADSQVWREAVVDDSSCTPQHAALSMMQAQQQIPQQHWNQPSVATGVQQPQSTFSLQNPIQAPPIGNGTLGTGVQTLLQNIGRGNMFSGLGHLDSGSLRSQGSYGSDSFGFNNAYNVQPLHAMNNSPMAHATAGGIPMFGNPQPHQMDVSSPNQHPFGATNSPPVPGDLQNLWMNLAQNPQLLNAAISMGLLQTPTPISPVIQAIPNQALPANAFARVTTLPQSQECIQQRFPTIPKIEVDPEAMSESVLSDAQAPSQIETERAKFPTPQSKRYKRGGSAKTPFARDRRKACFVGQIHPDASREDIEDFFAQAGKVVNVFLRRADNRNDLNWAFVQYATLAERDHALKTLDRSRFGGRELLVKAARLDLEFDPNEPVKECWFCLGSPASDKALIVSVGDHSYLAVDKGPISDDHVLIIPTNHYPNTLRMSERCYEEMELYLRGLREMFASQGRCLLAFERYLQIPRLHGNHTHISVISIDADAARVAKERFLQRGRRQSGEWTTLSIQKGNRDNIHDIVGDEEYLLVILPDGSKLVRPMFRKDRLPVSFGRDVMAELAGIPERADWKVCISSEADEKEKVQRFKAQFSSFDYPNQG